MTLGNLIVWTYRYTVKCEDRLFQILIHVRLTSIESLLIEAGQILSRDVTPSIGGEAIRNHVLTLDLGERRYLEVEVGYVDWTRVGVTARVNRHTVFESHPGRTLRYPKLAAQIVADPELDLAKIRRDWLAITVDVVLALALFLVADRAGLMASAALAVVVTLALLVLQRAWRVNLLGGLTLIGVMGVIASSLLALLFADEALIKLRSSLVGSVIALMFMVDAVFVGGRWLGRGMLLHIPYRNVSPRRLSLAMTGVGFATAAANYVVALCASTKTWLVYSTFFDTVLVAGLVLLALRYVRAAEASAEDLNRQPHHKVE